MCSGGGNLLCGSLGHLQVSPPSFSMYEKALHESPDAEIDGPVFAIEGSFADDEESAVSAFVRHCQSKVKVLWPMVVARSDPLWVPASAGHG